MSKKQFEVVEGASADPSQFLGSVVLVGADGLPWTPGGDTDPVAVTWGTLGGKPATFPPTLGTTATTALAGNTALLKVGAAATDAKAGNYTPTIANVTGLQAALDAKATVTALAELAARVTTLEAV